MYNWNRKYIYNYKKKLQFDEILLINIMYKDIVEINF